MENLKKVDSEIYSLIGEEIKRRRDGLEMIPSENHTSLAVLEALSSILNDKYSEGYPNKRYYGGCEIIDKVESLCQERVKKLFKVPYANVQPYSGSPANHAVHFATLNPGDKVMGMDLLVGGHLTHGCKVNFSGKYYKSFCYGVDKKTGEIDYSGALKLAKKEKPKLIWVGTTAYPRILDWKKFKKISDSVGAFLCADIAHIAGLIISGSHPSPAPYVDIITTTTHKTLRGPRGGIIMITHTGIKKDKNLSLKIDKAVFPGLQGGPHQHQIAGIAVSLKEASSVSFKNYGKQILKNSKALSKELIKNNFNLVTGGTDNHLMVIDLRNKNVSGQEAENLLEKSGITVNKNTVPFDPNPPYSPSGIRLGTPAITTRGMKEKEMKIIANWISEIIEKKDDKTCLKVKKEISNLCSKFPIPQLKNKI
jgi:glycine hydroxymethyltransferase